MDGSSGRRIADSALPVHGGLLWSSVTELPVLSRFSFAIFLASASSMARALAPIGRLGIRDGACRLVLRMDRPASPVAAWPTLTRPPWTASPGDRGGHRDWLAAGRASAVVVG